jgi:hypothetical protein
MPSSPNGLIAASHVDLPAVTERIIGHPASDDESATEAGTNAAQVLLALDATPVVGRGRPLAASVRGADIGYAGYPGRLYVAGRSGPGGSGAGAGAWLG